MAYALDVFGEGLVWVPSTVKRGAIHPNTQILGQIHPEQLHLSGLHGKVSIQRVHELKKKKKPTSMRSF